MTGVEHFAADYACAREKFLKACESSGLDVESSKNPGRGPGGEALYTDYTCFGADTADKVLVVNSGIHGVEGFCGSAAIIAWLHSEVHRALPADIRVVVVHALNPHGFAWLRRVNEGNVDLNRNFIAHGETVPVNPDYEQLHPHFVPDDWSEEAAAGIERLLAESARAHGLLSMQARVCRGQYRHAQGLFYGGAEASWSNLLFNRIAQRYVRGAGRVVLLDFHTGLGAYGEPELICARPPDERVRTWFSDRLTCAQLGNAVGPGLSGTIGQGLRRAVGEVDVYSITAEFGTYDVHRVLMALIADNWLHARGSVNGSAASTIKQETRTCFYPDTDEWRESMLAGSQRILREALAGLAGLT